MESFDLDLIIKVCNLKYIEKKQQKGKLINILATDGKVAELPMNALF